MKIKGVTFVRFFCLLIGISVLNACAVKQNKPAEHAQISIYIQDQDRIRFSGKGAGAGMMMSASMGAMGIAIGVAIDEGIAKEIHEAFVTSGNDFSDMVRRETQIWLAGTCSSDKKDKALCRAETLLTINVYRYGFVTASGENDPIKPELDIGFGIGEADELRVNLKETDISAALIPLEQTKKDGKPSAMSLRLGVQQILQKLAATL